MENETYRKDEQGNKPRENSETSEPIWKTDKDWREFYMIRLE